MRRSGRLFIALGAGLALVAVGLVLVVLLSNGGGDDEPESTSGQTETESEEPREISVVVAARDVPAHTLLTVDDLTEEVVSSEDVADDVVRTNVEALGLAYSVDLVAGQPLTQSNLELPGLANRIESGKRAVALPVDAQSLVGGQIRDDDHIDIIFNTRVTLQRVNPTYPLEAADQIELEDIRVEIEEGEEPTDGVVLMEKGQPPLGPSYPYPGEAGSRFWVTDVLADGDPVGKLILQNIHVLRVVSSSTSATAAEGDSGDEDSGEFLILELDPTQAELVDFLSKSGTFQVALRSPEDEAVVETPGVTMNTLVDNWGLTVPKTVRLPEAEGQ